MGKAFKRAELCLPHRVKMGVKKGLQQLGGGSKLKGTLPSPLGIKAMVAGLCLVTIIITTGDEASATRGRGLAAVKAGRIPIIPLQITLANYIKEFLKCPDNLSCKHGEEKLADLLPHDYEGHPWHWTRENKPDAKFAHMSDCKGDDYPAMYEKFHKEGYVIFDSCTILSDKKTLFEAAKFTDWIGGLMVVNAGVRQVKEIAADPDTLDFLQYLHGGRRPFPFRTESIPRGLEQSFHSDVIHHDTFPRTLMASTWTALEDVTKNTGPPQFVVGSHLLGTWDYDEINLLKSKHAKKAKLQVGDFQDLLEIYGHELYDLVKQADLKIKTETKIKKGQTVIMAAGLVHGSSKKLNYNSRLSQTTRYYFEGAEYYWEPKTSILENGTLNITTDTSCEPNPEDGKQYCAEVHVEEFTRKCPWGFARPFFWSSWGTCWEEDRCFEVLFEWGGEKVCGYRR